MGEGVVVIVGNRDNMVDIMEEDIPLEVLDPPGVITEGILIRILVDILADILTPVHILVEHLVIRPLDILVHIQEDNPEEGLEDILLLLEVIPQAGPLVTYHHEEVAFLPPLVDRGITEGTMHTIRELHKTEDLYLLVSPHNLLALEAIARVLVMFHLKVQAEVRKEEAILNNKVVFSELQLEAE